jgi:hypothetical protein
VRSLCRKPLARSLRVAQATKTDRNRSTTSLELRRIIKTKAALCRCDFRAAVKSFLPILQGSLDFALKPRGPEAVHNSATLNHCRNIQRVRFTFLITFVLCNYQLLWNTNRFKPF